MIEVFLSLYISSNSNRKLDHKNYKWCALHGIRNSRKKIPHQKLEAIITRLFPERSPHPDVTPYYFTVTIVITQMFFDYSKKKCCFWYRIFQLHSHVLLQSTNNITNAFVLKKRMLKRIVWHLEVQSSPSVSFCYSEITEKSWDWVLINIMNCLLVWQGRGYSSNSSQLWSFAEDAEKADSNNCSIVMIQVEKTRGW